MREIPVWLPDQPSTERLGSCHERALPDFLVIGAQRSGTTSLYDLLCTHPSVAPAVMKEIHYFDAWYDRGRCWYRAHFPLEAELREGDVRWATGEATPYLLYDDRGPNRVAETLGSPALIAILRDPVDRAWSHFHHQRRRGNEPIPTFEAAIEAEAARRGDGEALEGGARSDRDRSYLARGRYAEQLQRWIGAFGRERLLVLFTADLAADRQGTLSSSWGHLGVDPVEVPAVAERNPGHTPPLSARTRYRLREHFADCDRQL
ncbi:MAG: sulfotransferase domain-containing protein, partial [Actinobacteria bacterium]|nr:sulfotransferase domain-containing protein [Actinomycetota bacterium]